MPRAVELNSAFVSQVAKELEKKVVERLDKITLECQNILVSETNVDYGQARAGWNIFLNQEKFADVPKPERVKKGVPKVILDKPKNKPDQEAKKIGDKYFITNNVQHVIYINEGTSDAFPKGYIDRAPFEAVANVEASL